MLSNQVYLIIAKLQLHEKTTGTATFEIDLTATNDVIAGR